MKVLKDLLDHGNNKHNAFPIVVNRKTKEMHSGHRAFMTHKFAEFTAAKELERERNSTLSLSAAIAYQTLCEAFH
jgi:hypothetical protein